MTKFKELMKEKGYSQLALSKASGVAQSNLSLYCNYQYALEASTMITRLRLAKVFGITVEKFNEILGLEPAKIIASNKQVGTYEIIEVE